ncbi:radical SAM family heme chaperone HemW [Desulfurobacterium sp.]
MEVGHLYVHVPFCRTKCPYCDFYSTTGKVEPECYLNLLKEELKLKKLRVKPKTIYFGGGTPSLMPPSFFEHIISLFPEAEEITVEVNPDDVNHEYLKGLKSAGVNRISLGIQTFDDSLLKILKRKHTGTKGIKSIETAISIFDNVSIDLIFGIPGQDEKSMEKDLKTLMKFPLKHVSTYALTIYEKTPFHRLFKEKKYALPSEETFSKYYSLIVEKLSTGGFYQYEISNFSKLQFECKHNLAYWDMKNYLGIGPSAASLLANKYQKNVDNYFAYKNAISSGKVIYKEEVNLSREEVFKIKLAMGLRKTNGVNLKVEEEKVVRNSIEKSPFLQNLLNSRILILEKRKLKLNPEFLFVSSYLISRIGEEIIFPA